MKKLLPDFSNYKVLVLGDVMLDQYIYGAVHRISPEAPVPVMLREKTSLKAGGAANVALTIKALGAQPFLVGVLGKDLSGDRLVDVLEKEGIDTRFLIRSKLETTSVKTRLVAGNQHLLRIDEENDAQVDEVIENELIQLITELVDREHIDAILVEDYDKGILSKKLIRHIQILAKERPLKLTVDPKFRHFLDFQDFDLFKPNLREVNQALHQHIEANIADLEKAGRMIQQKTACRNVMITLGDQGMFAMEGDKIYHQSAEHLDIVDVCGAGDAVISTATLCLIADLSLEDILFWSNKAGAEVCRYPGVVAVSRHSLES